MMASSLALRLMVKCSVNQSISNRRAPPPVAQRWPQIQCVCVTKSLQKFGLAVTGSPAAGPSQEELETCRPEPDANSHCAGSALDEAVGPRAPGGAEDSQSFAPR